MSVRHMHRKCNSRSGAVRLIPYCIFFVFYLDLTPLQKANVAQFRKSRNLRFPAFSRILAMATESKILAIAGLVELHRNYIGLLKFTISQRSSVPKKPKSSISCFFENPRNGCRIEDSGHCGTGRAAWELYWSFKIYNKPT